MIADEVGFGYGTVQYMCHNRVYLGETRLRDEWLPGLHPPLVNVELFNAAQRGHTPGKRRSKDLLSGKVRCGTCGRVAGVAYNDRNQAIYRCRHRGQGCPQPGRSALGLRKAARLGISVLGADADLQAAIRHQLTRERPEEARRSQSLIASIAGLKERQNRLLDLYCNGQIPGPQFASKNDDLTRQVATLEKERVDLENGRGARVDTASSFERVVELLARVDFADLWDAATDSEQRTLSNELIDSIYFYPDRLTVQVVGAPPILVELDEVGLRAGSRSVVSEARREPPPGAT